MYFTTTKSPLGPLTLFADDNNIIALEFGCVDIEKPSKLLKKATSQLDAYFKGHLKYFSLPLKTSGTSYQQNVWELILKIPYGQTLSYGELACKLKSSPRSVGGACGKNPIPIIIPCHRVLKANNKIGGFSPGFSISTKASLLQLEGLTKIL